MTNLKKVNEGQNKYCGPAVLSILTGRSTDECARVVSQINGEYKVKGVSVTDIEKAAERLGFATKRLSPQGSLYRTLISIVSQDGMYIVSSETHYWCIEVKDKKIYFCDNHTKEPIPAGSSARLNNEVKTLTKVTKNYSFKEYTPPPKVIVPPSPAFLEVLNLCSAAEFLRKQKDSPVSLKVLRDSTVRVYFKIINIEEMEQANKRMQETEWL
jgi:hypothetical protein